MVWTCRFINTIDDKEKIKWQELFRQSAQVLLVTLVFFICQDFGARSPWTHRGQLHPDYPACGAGFDQMVLDGLGLDKEETLAYIHENRPSYTEFEKWILDKKGGSLDQAAVDELNAAITGYNHDDDTRGAILGAAGVADDGSILDAVNLNNLEDWTDWHAALTG